MKCLLIAVAVPVLAVGQSLPSLPVSEFADTEVSVCHPLVLPGTGVCGLNFDLEFTGTSSNNVEIALGRDSDGDGELSFDETGIKVGWDCGRYFIERASTGERFEELSVGTNGQNRILKWECFVKRQEMRGLSVHNEVGMSFVSVTSNPPSWLYDAEWNAMRLTARGPEAVDEHFEVDVRTRGLLILLR